MGFSVTGSHVVFFIASVIAAGAVSGVFLAVTFDLNTSFSERGERVQEVLDTEFAVINDPNHIPLSSGDYLFYLKNLGRNQLVTTEEIFTVFINGEVLTTGNYNFSVNQIKPGEISTLYIDSSVISSGSQTLRLVGPQSIDDEFIFTIP
jgi:archaeal flagellar protein FlaG